MSLTHRAFSIADSDMFNYGINEADLQNKMNNRFRKGWRVWKDNIGNSVAFFVDPLDIQAQNNHVERLDIACRDGRLFRILILPVSRPVPSDINSVEPSNTKQKTLLLL